MLILLDIDGVMIPAKPWSAPPVLADGFSIFKPQSVDALNEILANSNADILLTTSHKGRFSIDQWIDIFNNRGIDIKKIKRLKTNTNHLSRLEEVINWFSSKNDIKDFVIIDDDTSLNNLPEYLKARLVLTKPLIGLTKSHVQDSLKILNTPLELV